MLRRRTKQKRIFVADIPLLRDRYAEEIAASALVLMSEDDTPADAEVEVRPISEDYREWLRVKGIDPETGHMTEAGLGIFKCCLDEDRQRKASHGRG